jgi:uncharacterized alkaline shock family protein YloU
LLGSSRAWLSEEVASRDGGDQCNQDPALCFGRDDVAGKAWGGRAPATRGRTTIADGVVEKIAGMAAREVPSIHALGGGLARIMGAVRDMVPGGRTSVTRGVKVEVGERQTAIDLSLVVEYGFAIIDATGEVRENVIAAVERMTGLDVVEVNISVTDVHLPDEEDEGEAGAAAQRPSRPPADGRLPGAWPSATAPAAFSSTVARRGERDGDCQSPAV